jgi:hypothetical protein
MFTRATQCIRGVLDPPVSAFSLSLYRHPFLYTLFNSRFTLIINNTNLGGFGLTPNVITQTSVKVAMASRFLGMVGSLPLDEQSLWLPNQQGHVPDSWTDPHFLQLKTEYDVLMIDYRCKVQEMYTV